MLEALGCTDTHLMRRRVATPEASLVDEDLRDQAGRLLTSRTFGSAGRTEMKKNVRKPMGYQVNDREEK